MIEQAHLIKIIKYTIITSK